MRRRDFLLITGATALGLSTIPFGWASAAGREKLHLSHTFRKRSFRWGPAAGKKKQKVLYFTRSAGFEHGPVKRKDNELAFSEKTLIEMGKRAGFDVECTKDGRVFDGDLHQYDAFAFYTSGDLTKPDKLNTPPMTPEGKQRLLDAIAAGKGFVGIHSATDSFHCPGEKLETQQQVDPYIAMLGGEFIAHGAQQEATLTVTSPKFPGLEGVDKSLRLLEEWYTLKNFSKDLHVILLQETQGMTGPLYQRPAFPATWARMHHQGRVFYTSFGHRDDIWTNPVVQQIMLGGFAWVMRNVDADVPPNLDQVAPGANQLPKPEPKKPAPKGKRSKK